MKNILFGCALLMSISACEDTGSVNPPADMILYKNLNDVRAGYNQPFSLDINNDGISEYVFVTSLIGTNEGFETHFKIYPVRSNRLFVSNLIPSIVPEGNAIEGQSFSKFVEPMVIKTTIGEGTTLLGDWKDAQNFYAGIQFQLGNDPYRYGWLRLSFDQVNEQFVIHDLAYENFPGKAIKAGDIQ
jgi:hypothetical protein